MGGAWPNAVPPPKASIATPSQCILAYCNWWSAWPTGGQPVGKLNTHASGRPTLYADGSVRAVKEYAIPDSYGRQIDGKWYYHTGVVIDDIQKGL